MIRAALAAFVLIAAPAAAASQDAVTATANPTLRTVPLTISTPHGVRRFAVEVARSEPEQERGLMFRRTMAATHGMIFPMDPPRPASFWMKNTILPLDIVFIGPDHRILSIGHGIPFSLATIDCADPVIAVLEMKAGTAARLRIAAGDTVAW